MQATAKPWLNCSASKTAHAHNVTHKLSSRKKWSAKRGSDKSRREERGTGVTSYALNFQNFSLSMKSSRMRQYKNPHPKRQAEF